MASLIETPAGCNSKGATVVLSWDAIAWSGRFRTAGAPGVHRIRYSTPRPSVWLSLGGVGSVANRSCRHSLPSDEANSTYQPELSRVLGTAIQDAYRSSRSNRWKAS